MATSLEERKTEFIPMIDLKRDGLCQAFPAKNMPQVEHPKPNQHTGPGNDIQWLVGFYGISTFVGYLMPNPFLYK